MRKPRLLIPLVPVALAAGWSGLWLWSADALEGALAQWRAQQAARGIAVDYRGPEIGGFPTGLTARFEGPSAAAAPRASGGGWHWHGPDVTGSARVWAPFTIETAFAGRHEIAVAPRPGAPELSLEAEAAEATAEATLRRDGTLEQSSFRLAGLTVAPQGGEPASVEVLTGRFGPARRAAGEGLPRIDLAAEAEGVSLPERLRVPLGRQIERAVLDAVLVGEIPPGPPERALAQWRDAGGQLEVARLALDWGPMTLEAEGNASLDAQYRPIGAFTARVDGLVETLDALARDGVIEPGQALAVRIAVLALGGLTGSSGGGGAEAAEGGASRPAPDLEVQITLQDGRLYLGPVPLFRLSPVL